MSQAHHTPELQERLDALIEEATRVAKDRGILTEIDAAEEERMYTMEKKEDWSRIIDGISMTAQEKRDMLSFLQKERAACTDDSECAPHGTCNATTRTCSCKHSHSGKYCAHPILYTA